MPELLFLNYYLTIPSSNILLLLLYIFILLYFISRFLITFFSWFISYFKHMTNNWFSNTFCRFNLCYCQFVLYLQWTCYLIAISHKMCYNRISKKKVLRWDSGFSTYAMCFSWSILVWKILKVIIGKQWYSLSLILRVEFHSSNRLTRTSCH